MVDMALRRFSLNLAPLIGLSVLAGCVTDRPKITEEDSEVVSLALMEGQYVPNAKQLAMLNTTVASDELLKDGFVPAHIADVRRYNGAYVDCAGDMGKRNEDITSSADFKFSKPLKPIERSETLDAKNLKIEVFEPYKADGGMYMFALPGYNKEHTYCLVYVARTYGPDRSHSMLVTLKKEGGKWKVDKAFPATGKF